MTRKEFYKLTDILNSEVLGNFMHGGEADELIAMFEEAVVHSNILKQEEPVSEDLNKAAKNYADNITDKIGYKRQLRRAVVYGARWQKEKDSILPKVWKRENLEEFSYQTAYDLSNDWIKETPTWHDVEMACKLGAKWKEEQLEKNHLAHCDATTKGEITKSSITEDYVSFETAKLLKEKGFDEDIDLWYDENGDMFFQHKYEIKYDWRVRQGLKIYQRPTIQMAMKWLREVRNISIVIEPHAYDYINEKNSSYVFSTWLGDNYYENPLTKDFPSYEETCEMAIKYCIENLI